MNFLHRFFPFLRWYPFNGSTLRADLIAGITVALVLIPQSMAYAQLAGLPPYYGLYASFLPVVIAALWGSSRQLAGGPVAMVSILTSSALVPLAAVGSDQFVTLAIALSILVGAVQLALGLFKLGAIVNFLSHPVIVGFTNAAALIIGLSQLNKIFGVSMGRTEVFLYDIWGVVKQIPSTHLPTLIMGIGAIAVIVGLKKLVPKAPAVLIAVVIATTVSWAVKFERNETFTIDQISDLQTQSLGNDFINAEAKIKELSTRIAEKNSLINKTKEEAALAALHYEEEVLKIQLNDATNENRVRMRDLRKFKFEVAQSEDGTQKKLFPYGQVPSGFKGDSHRWRINKVTDGKLQLVGGGEVVGKIPEGLPKFGIPHVTWDTVVTLLSSALVISLVGFMEAISMAKAMAAKTKQRLDPNQELIGQGLANITGSFTQSFPTSGSFSRSAVNFNAGAQTGMASVFTAIVVVIVLLVLTPYLYHLPQAVLAAIIMVAVAGLINFKPIIAAWRANIHDGVAAIVTFVATLGFAPHLDDGIMVGAGLAVILYLYRTMKPHVALLGRHADGTLRDAKIFNLPLSEHIAAVRFDGDLYFANVPYFEDAILEVSSKFPKAKHILVVGEGINAVDASGDEAIHHLNERLRSNGVTLSFSGLKYKVLEVLKKTGRFDEIGKRNFYITEDHALTEITKNIDDATFDAEYCPLIRPADNKSPTKNSPTQIPERFPLTQ